MNKTFWYPECKCDPTGSRGSVCNENGYCSCKIRYGDQKCTGCASGYFQSNGLYKGKIQLPV